MSGTLRELAPSKRDGKQRWELRVFVGRDPAKAVRDPDTGKVTEQGPPIHVSKVFKGGQREAKRQLEKLVIEVRQNRRLAGSPRTVSQLLDQHLANLERLDRSRSTIETYRHHIERHLRPGLGSIRVEALTAEHIDHLLGTLHRDHALSPRTIELNHAILRSALSQAVRWKWIPDNPAKDASVGKRADPPRDVKLTTDQLGLLIKTAMNEDPDMGVMLGLAAITGCRRGELAGLRWSDLDSVAETLRVERAWVPGRGGQYLTRTKTRQARTIYIGSDGVGLLKRYKEFKELQVGHEPEGWLLSLNGGVTPLRAKSMTEYVGRLAKRLGVPAHLHTLRHWAASELNHVGVDLPTAARQLGHTEEVLARRYLHSTDERAAVAGELLSSVVVGLIDQSALDEPPGSVTPTAVER